MAIKLFANQTDESSENNANEFANKTENSSEIIAKNSTDSIDQKVENNIEKENKTMAEKKVNNPENENETPAETAKKEPVAKAKVKKADAEERITGFKGFVKHPIKYVKQNKKAVGHVAAAFGIGVGTGVAGAYGAAKLGETMANRRAAARDRDEDLEIK